MFHQDIYGSGYDHSDSDGMILRTQLTPIIDSYDIDAVLQGHDHTYSRTYQISANGIQTAYDSSNYKANEETYLSDNAKCYTYSGEGTRIVNPEGTVYFEANSSTGSKYYQMIGTQQNYIAARSQSWRPTYSVISISENELTVKTYDAATNSELVADGNVSTSYTIVKENKNIDSSNNDTSTDNNSSNDNKVIDNKNDDNKVTTSKVAKVKLSVVKKAGKRAVTVKYGKVANASGYKLQYAANKSFKNAKSITVSKCKTSVKIKELKKKTYYFRVRAYKTVNGKKVYGNWSNVRKYTIK